MRSVTLAQGDPKIAQSIFAILSTRKGERLHRPTFGCFAGDTEVLLVSGEAVPIQQATREPGVLGVTAVPGSSREPGRTVLVPTNTDPPWSGGIRATVRLTLSNGATVTCTPDHLFLGEDRETWLPAASLTGSRLCWVDRAVPDFWNRTRSWYATQRDSGLYSMPMSARSLRVVRVEGGPECEVYDLPNSTTGNYALAAGPVVHNSDLPRLVFDQSSPALLSLLRFETATALQNWEKRIQVVDVQFSGSGDLDSGQVGIRILYRILKTNQVGTYVYPFQRDSPPFSLNLATPLGSPDRP